jgi:microcystin-dependent protein
MAGPSGATPNLSLPYPVPDDSVDVPRDIQALATALDAGRAVPVGSLLMWPTAAPPTGFLVCNGSTVSSATYPALAAVLGEAGGLVTLPDLRDTFPVGAGPTMALGSKGGAAAVTLSGPQSGVPAHTHAHTLAIANGGVHDHALNTAGDGVSSGSGGGYAARMSKNSGTSVGNTNDSASHSHGVTGAISNAAAANAAASHENRPPFLSINFIIRAA